MASLEELVAELELVREVRRGLVGRGAVSGRARGWEAEEALWQRIWEQVGAERGLPRAVRMLLRDAACLAGFHSDESARFWRSVEEKEAQNA